MHTMKYGSIRYGKIAKVMSKIKAEVCFGFLWLFRSYSLSGKGTTALTYSSRMAPELGNPSLHQDRSVTRRA